MWMAIHLGMSTPCENFHDPHKQAPLLRKVSGERFHSADVANIYAVTLSLPTGS